MADRLSVTTVGSASQPVYFKNGVPVACDDDIGSGLSEPIILEQYNISYGDEFPASVVEGQLFFKTDTTGGLPSGGTAGQVLTKISSAEGDAAWQEVQGLPTGGTAGQALVKSSATDGDAAWTSITPASIGAAATSALNSYLPLTGEKTVSGQVIFSKTSDVSVASSSECAIVVGTKTGAHLGIDPNEIQAKASETTSASLYLNNDGGNIYLGPSVYSTGSVLYGAAWNDYAEFRELKDKEEIPYGYVVVENGDDTLSLSSSRLQGGGNVCSDTYGFAIGETEKAKMPIAVSGRVLVYPYEDRLSYSPGDAVCTGPNGTVSKMTREEIKEYPDRILGYVSAIPQYEIWGDKNIAVNGRIWIKVI